MNNLMARLLMVIAIALVPVVACQAYREVDARRVPERLMEAAALRVASRVAADQQRMIEGVDQAFDRFRGASLAPDTGPALCQQLLANLLDLAPGYSAAAVIGLDGRIVCAPDPYSRGVDLSDQAYFRHALRQDELVFGEHGSDLVAGRKSIQIAKSFTDLNGIVAGVVAVSLSLQSFGDQLHRVSVPAGARVLIMDRNGTVLASNSGNGPSVNETIALEAPTRSGQNELSVKTTRTPDGQQFVTAYAPLGAPLSGLAVAVVLHPKTTFARIAWADPVGQPLMVGGGSLMLLLTAIGLTAIGNPRLVRRSVNPSKNAAGKDSRGFGHLGAADEVAAAAIRHRGRALGMALESTTDYVMVIDQAWHFSYLNECAKAFLGGQELIGHSFWDVAPRLGGSALADCCRIALERRLPNKIETDCKHPDRRFEISIYPSEDCVTLFVRDVTQERRTNADLLQSEARLQLAREAAGFGIWDWDIVAGSMVWSEQNWRLYGQTPRTEGPEFALWRSWLHPDDRDNVVAARQVAVGEPGRPLDIEHRIVCLDGTVRWLLCKATVVRSAGGGADRLVGLNMDITPRREAEAALRRLRSDLERRVDEAVAAREAAQVRAAQAERVQALGQLAGGIAHDFNNILQTISGAMVQIKRHLPSDPVTGRLSTLADEAIERGASITRRVLTFGRRGAQRFETLDVAELLADLTEILSHTLGSGVTLRIKLGADLHPLKADRHQLETVMVNLATNARDAMARGGQLILAADNETVRIAGPSHPAALTPGAYVRLTVTDTGSGMDAEILAKAREPFFTTKQVGMGTGLGLSMAQGFAEQSDGALSIDSIPGEGTTVTLWLPQASGDVVRRAPPLLRPTLQNPSPQHPASGPRIARASLGRVLLVDDESTILEVLAHQLEDAGYQVVTAAGGVEALASLVSAPPIDAIVTDLSMPEIDGVAVIRAAQERFPTMPAVLLTGYAGEDATEALGTSIAGAVSVLCKPVRAGHLLDRLGGMLAARRAADERQTVAASFDGR